MVEDGRRQSIHTRYDLVGSGGPATSTNQCHGFTQRSQAGDRFPSPGMQSIPVQVLQEIGGAKSQRNFAVSCSVQVHSGARLNTKVDYRMPLK